MRLSLRECLGISLVLLFLEVSPFPKDPFLCQHPIMRAFCSKRPTSTSSDARTLRAFSKSYVPSVWNPGWRPKPPKCGGALSRPGRGAKTKASMKVQDLPQGVIGTHPLPELETDDAPQYPAVVQGAKNNMAKFNDCVVLTRVGNFYEVSILPQMCTLRGLTQL